MRSEKMSEKNRLKSLENYVPKPDWLKNKLKTGREFFSVENILKEDRIYTVCEEARCPNMKECWGEHKTATFLLLGDVCTRRCRFCAVKTGLPKAPSETEPEEVAKAALRLKLNHVVLTMVNRDDLEDGGVSQIKKTIGAVRSVLPGSSVEVLSSDLMGSVKDIRTLIHCVPDIISHNLETVERLTPFVRSRSEYKRSLFFLKTAEDNSFGIPVKSGLMLGLGESYDEILRSMDDLLENGVSILNMGQYLQPTRRHLQTKKYWSAEEFASLKEKALEKGFSYVESGPLVRSSYHAGGQFRAFLKNKGRRAGNL